ncbi:MAG: GAF domain-containing sensor histidine kinase [Chloroflexaceae bacterium]|nr:GAF domain-containing sensor histidine kinase [Chloroflexaceae bacterium]
MATVTLDHIQLETLSQLLVAGGHHDISELLEESLRRLISFWPARAGALLYVSPQSDMVHLEHGPLNQEARTLIEQARTGFIRREDGSEPTVGYYSLEGGYDLLEMPLQGGGEGVGLLHLVVVETGPEKQTGTTTPLRPDEDLLILLVRAIGGEADKLAHLRRAERDLRELRLLYEVGQSLAINLDLPSLLSDIQRRVPDVVDAERCSIFILDESGRELVVTTLDASQEMRMPADEGIAGWVVSHGISQIVNDVDQDNRWYEAISRETDFDTRSIVCVPMQVHNRIVGAMQLLNKRGGGDFSDQDVQLLSTLATQAAIAVENARIHQSLKQERDRLLTKEEEVRHSIARDLHDGPTQSLSAIAMNIEFVKKLLVAMPERVAGELDTLSDLVNKTIYDIRTLLFELRPLSLETQGLLTTLQQYVKRWRDPSGHQTRLRLEALQSVPLLPYETESAAFMIIQEAVNNARKHANSPEIAIYLYEEEGHLVASVRDRGRGFDMNTVEANYDMRNSLGLINMKERARLIGGDLRIRSEPGKGTIVELRIPLS